MSPFMLTCREASRLASEALDRKLSMRERMMLAMHLAVCRGCKRVTLHYRFLRRAMSEWLEAPADERDVAGEG